MKASKKNVIRTVLEVIAAAIAYALGNFFG